MLCQIQPVITSQHYYRLTRDDFEGFLTTWNVTVNRTTDSQPVLLHENSLRKKKVQEQGT